MAKYEKQTVIYTSICHGLIHVMEMTYGAVLIGIAGEFGASLLVLGILANVLGFAFGFASLPAGVLADRVSERRLLMFCCLGMSLSSIAIGLSPNIYVLGVALLALGLALGIYHPTGAAYIARVATNRGLAFGYLGIGGNIGLAVGPIVAGAVASLWGWRSSYLILALPAILLAVLFAVLARNEGRITRQPTVTEAGAVKIPVRPFILPLAVVCCVASLNGFIYRGAVTFLPIYLSQRIHLSFLNMDSLMIAGSFTTIALVFGVGGQFMGGYLSQRRSRESLAVLTALVTAPLLLVMGNNAGMALMAAAIVFAFFHFMGQPVYNNLVADYTPAEWRGRVFGIYFFSTFGVGSFSASLLGYVADQFGTNWVFTVSAGFALLTLVLALFLLARSRRFTAKF